MASVFGNGQVSLPTHNTRALYSHLCGSTRSNQDGRATLNPRLVTPTAQGAGEGRSKDLHPPPCRHKREELKLPPSILRLPRTEVQGRGSHTTSTLALPPPGRGAKASTLNLVAAPAQ